MRGENTNPLAINKTRPDEVYKILALNSLKVIQCITKVVCKRINIFFLVYVLAQNEKVMYVRNPLQ